MLSPLDGRPVLAIDAVAEAVLLWGIWWRVPQRQMQAFAEQGRGRHL